MRRAADGFPDWRQAAQAAWRMSSFHTTQAVTGMQRIAPNWFRSSATASAVGD